MTDAMVVDSAERSGKWRVRAKRESEWEAIFGVARLAGTSHGKDGDRLLAYVQATKAATGRWTTRQIDMFKRLAVLATQEAANRMDCRQPGDVDYVYELDPSRTTATAKLLADMKFYVRNGELSATAEEFVRSAPMPTEMICLAAETLRVLVCLAADHPERATELARG